MTRSLRIGLVLVVVLVVQLSLFNQLRIGGVAAESMLALTIVAGASYGPDTGAKLGFASGLLYDIALLTTPLGLTAATYVLVGYGAGVIREGMSDPPWWLRFFGVALASAFGVAVFAILGEVLGQDTFSFGRLPRLFVVIGLFNSAIAPALGAVLRFAMFGAGATARESATT